MSSTAQHKGSALVDKCLSLEELTKYVNGELTEKEKFSFENHLVNCELCTDAIEGFAILKDQETLNDVIGSLHQEVQDKSGYRPSRVISFEWKKMVAIAATLIVLTGIGFMVNGLIKHNGSLAWFNPEKNQSNELEASKSEKDILEKRQNSKLKADEQQSGLITDGIFEREDELNEPASIEILAEVNEDRTRPEDDNFTAVQPPVFSSNATDDLQWKTVDVIEDESAEQSDEEIISGAASTTLGNRNQSMEPASLSLPESAATAPTANGDNTNTDDGYVAFMDSKKKSADVANLEAISTSNNKSLKQSNAAPTIDGAMTSYYNTDYKKALNDFEDIIKANPTNRKAIYHAGVSSMNLGKNNKAIPYFDNLIDSPGTFTESSKWLKAQILIKKNKKDDAKILLKDISGGSGKYKEQAADLLQKL